jgi:hypothetical protein
MDKENTKATANVQHPRSTSGKPGEVAVLPLVYDLILWYSRKINAFPKKFKFTLGDRITTTQLDILEQLIEARYNRKRRGHYLRQANVSIEKLRYLARLSKDLQCMSLKEYEHAARKLQEIGNMVGGWEKYSKGKESGEEI